MPAREKQIPISGHQDGQDWAKRKFTMKTYSECVITLLDVLGFKNIVNRKPADEIWQILGLLEEITQSSASDRTELGRNIFAFSDTVVRTSALTTPNGKRPTYGVLYHEILNMVHVQMSLIYRHKVFLRGAITCGDVIHESQRIFGPGFLRAYELETQIACFPRIVIDPDALTTYQKTPALRASHHTHSQDVEYVARMLREDTDGVWFVDYLAAAKEEVGGDCQWLRFLSKHKDAIIEAASGQETMSRISQKYNWLADYHNRVVAEKGDEYFYRQRVRKSDIEITRSAMPSMRVLPSRTGPPPTRGQLNDQPGNAGSANT
jgi:hypothetical protein